MSQIDDLPPLRDVVERHGLMAQKALGHKRLETTARHYILDELQVGLTDDLF